MNSLSKAAATGKKSSCPQYCNELPARPPRIRRREDGAGLRQFARHYPPAKCFLLYGGDRREYQGGIEVWPLAEALRCLPAILSAGAGGG